MQNNICLTAEGGEKKLLPPGRFNVCKKDIRKVRNWLHVSLLLALHPVIYS